MPSGGPTAASSLYSGIFNEERKSAVPSSSKPVETNDTNAKEQKQSPNDADGEDGTTATAKPQAWSAALRFAPRKNVNTQAHKARRPPASAFVSSAFSSAPAPQEIEPDSGGPSKLSGIPITRSEASTSSAWKGVGGSLNEGPSVQIDALQMRANEQDVKTSLPVVLAPPPLSISEEEIEKDKILFATLAEKRGEPKQGLLRHDDAWLEDNEDEDVNGFADTKEGKKAKRKKHKKKQNGGPLPSLRMDADYDVRVPNDFNEVKDLIQKRRQAIKQMAKEKEMEDNFRRYGGYPGQDEDGHVSDSEEEPDSFRQNKLGRFAPPASYSQTTILQPTTSFEFEEDDEKPYLSPPPSVLPSALPAATASPDSVPTPALVSSGEEAYQRRLAMSQPGSNSVGRSASSTFDQEDTNADLHTQAVPDLATRAAAAAAIAARLAKAAPVQSDEHSKPSAPVFVASSMHQQQQPPQQDAGSFAERLMAKQGWKRGEALGAEGNKGMLDPVLAEKVEVERRRKRHYDDSTKQASHSNRGTIVSAREDSRKREELQKFGTPSEVILLEEMVDLADIDDDLSDEIGEECAKHGYVQAVFIWPNGPRGVRIFVKFSGMAGAWRCVKELEGRFFGGKTVRARYYPLHDFERGNYMILYE